MKKFYFDSAWQTRLLFFLLSSCSLFQARAERFPFAATYSGANEVPPNASTATGTIVGVYDDATNTIYYNIVFSGLSANATAAHFHAPAAPGVNAGVTLGHAGFPAGVTSGNYSKIDVFTDAQETNLKAGLMYSNIHTSALPGGEIRAQIILGAASTEIYTFNRTYSGSQEVPPNASTATGTIMGAYNASTNTFSLAGFLLIRLQHIFMRLQCRALMRGLHWVMLVFPQVLQAEHIVKPMYLLLHRKQICWLV
jgi:hypothetical protein